MIAKINHVEGPPLVLLGLLFEEEVNCEGVGYNVNFYRHGE